MKIAFYGTKSYDKEGFEAVNNELYQHEIKFLKPRLTEDTVCLANGFDAICAFVNDTINESVLKEMNNYGIKLLLLRCAGYNNVDLNAANKLGIKVFRVPSYSPEAVAEHAMALAQTANRKIHLAYFKTKFNDFSLEGNVGKNLYGKTAGIIGTGKIGLAMAKICKGYGMNVIGYDAYPNPDLNGIIKYVSLDELLANSDLISLHCPLFETTHHMINKESIEKMKDGVIFVNTSRGGLVNTNDLIEAIRNKKFHAVGLDVFEEEGDVVFNDMSLEFLQHSTVARILQFPNVVLTAHQAFLTQEALKEIANTTLQNVDNFINKTETNNEVK